MNLEAAPQQQNPFDIIHNLSTEQKRVLDLFHNSLGLPPFENMIDIYLEDNPGDQGLNILLNELKTRLANTEDFKSKLKEIFSLIG